MYHSFNERIQFTIISSLSKTIALSSKFNILDPCPMEGPIKSWLSICLFVCPSAVGHFYQEWVVSFHRFFAPWQIIGIFKNCQSHFLSKIHFFPKFGQKLPKMTPKQVFFDFLKYFVISFPGNNLKQKLLLLLIFHHQSHIRQNSGSRVMCQNAVGQSNCRIL